jgi:hypothetical protein
MKLKVKKDKWKIKFKQNNLKELTSNVKSPCHTQKCQKSSQLLNSWMAPSFATLNKYHQDQMITYWRSASSKDLVFLYS